MSLRFRGGAPGEARELLLRAQGGDREARDQLLSDFTPFVLRIATQVTGRHLRPGHDDEVSVALVAFNQAIDGYRDGRGSFAAFAETVVRRRLIDYQRRARASREVPLTALEETDEEGHVSTPVLDRVARHTWELREAEEARRQEIAELAAWLRRFGLEFSDLAAHSPKHRDARERALSVAHRIVEDPALRQHVLTRGELPLARLESLIGAAGRKMLERYRRYLIAVVIILAHRDEWPHLAGFVKSPGTGEG